MSPVPSGGGRTALGALGTPARPGTPPHAVGAVVWRLRKPNAGGYSLVQVL